MKYLFLILTTYYSVTLLAQGTSEEYPPLTPICNRCFLLSRLQRDPSTNGSASFRSDPKGMKYLLLIMQPFYSVILHAQRHREGYLRKFNLTCPTKSTGHTSRQNMIFISLIPYFFPFLTCPYYTGYPRCAHTRIPSSRMAVCL